MNNENNTIDTWAIVELMGHQRMAGKVSEHQMGNNTLIRVDVPATDANEEFTRFVNPSSLYAINPVSEETARIEAERIKFTPINKWDMARMFEQRLAQLKEDGKVLIAGDDE